jgi:hypothetical protein
LTVICRMRGLSGLEIQDCAEEANCNQIKSILQIR